MVFYVDYLGTFRIGSRRLQLVVGVIPSEQRLERSFIETCLIVVVLLLLEVVVSSLVANKTNKKKPKDESQRGP